jgi:uncharacterized protein (TIGR00255 family)
MIRSMTAFARSEARGTWGELVWELRSVNHRFLEVSVRLPEEMRSIDPKVRELVQQRLSRGKVDCALRFRPRPDAAADLTVNQTLTDQLMATVEVMRERMPNAPEPSVMDILRWPGVLESAEQDLTPIQIKASSVLEAALTELVEVRTREGGRLAELLAQRCGALREQVRRARERMPTVLAGVRERLSVRLADFKSELDPQRVEQEIAILAQKLDVDEEMDRLWTHLDEIERVLQQADPVGRRLDFLMQELNREANTLASKSVDSETTAVSVEMKVLIEQMREQVQNVE